MLRKQPPVARQPLEQLTQQQQQENVNKAAGQQVSCIKSLVQSLILLNNVLVFCCFFSTLTRLVHRKGI